MAKTYKDSNKDQNKDSKYSNYSGAKNYHKVKTARKPKFFR